MTLKRPFLSFVSLALLAMGCGGRESPPSAEAVVDDDALFVKRAESHARFTPALHEGGELRAPTSCAPAGEALACEFDSGTLTLTPEERGVALSFRASRAATIEGVELVGRWRESAAESFLSAGFQSWSQTGFVALAEAPPEDALLTDVRATGDAEVIRGGAHHSWFYSLLTAPGREALMVGLVGVSPFKSWVAPARVEGDVSVRLVQGLTGEQLALEEGEEVDLAAWTILLHEDANAAFEDYAARLDYRQGGPDAVELGWNSWYHLWNGVSAEDVRENAALARQLLGDGGGEGLRVVVDDGWQRQWGDWQPNEKFPEGLAALVDELEGYGHEVGLWFAPLLVHAESELAIAHPEWLVGGVTWTHLQAGEMHILDVTHPEAEAHLRGVIGSFREAGMTLLKMDFLFAGTFEGERNVPMTGMQAYDLAMRIIRDAAGDGVALLAVGAPPNPTFPYAEAWRLGPDIALEPFPLDWAFIGNEARAIAGRYAFCAHLACDGDPALLRDLPRHEVEVGQWVAGLSGGAFFLSDDLPSVPSERYAWILPEAIALGTSGVPATPRDLVPQSPPASLASGILDALSGRFTQVVPAEWALADGRTLFINWSTEPIRHRERDVAARSYALFD